MNGSDDNMSEVVGIHERLTAIETTLEYIQMDIEDMKEEDRTDWLDDPFQLMVNVTVILSIISGVLIWGFMQLGVL